MRKVLVIAILALAVSTAYADDTIYDIQNGTIPSGTHVNVEIVVVTAAPYEYTSSGAYCFVEEPGRGAYSGVEVYWGTDQAGIYGGLVRGDVVNVYGVAAEYYDMTEIDISAPGDTLTVCGTCTPLEPEVVPLDQMMGEEWEAVLVKTNCCVCIQAANSYGEWYIEDAYGVGKCDDKSLVLTYVAAYGDWRIISGIVWYAYGEFNLSPRDDADIFDPGGPTATEATTWGGIKALYR